MTIVAHAYDYVIGGDTHRDTHSLAVMETTTGTVIHELVINNDTTGFEQATNLLEELAGSCLWALEGTGSYGINLTRHLRNAAQTVVEVERPARPKNYGPKTDAIDAERAAREILSVDVDRLGVPRDDGVRSSIAVLMNERDSAVEAAKGAVQQFHALLVTAPQPIRDEFVGLSTRMKLRKAAGMRKRGSDSPFEATVRGSLKRLAGRQIELSEAASVLLGEIGLLIKSWRPDLLEVVGVGPVTAASFLVAWSHEGRFRDEAEFASHAGVSPVPVSSGLKCRYRLNRGGDRQLNSAFHTVVMARMRHCEETKSYVERRVSEGRTVKEIRRCLKRYVARQVFKQLENGS